MRKRKLMKLKYFIHWKLNVNQSSLKSGYFDDFQFIVFCSARLTCNILKRFHLFTISHQKLIPFHTVLVKIKKKIIKNHNPVGYVGTFSSVCRVRILGRVEFEIFHDCVKKKSFNKQKFCITTRWKTHEICSMLRYVWREARYHRTRPSSAGQWHDYIRDSAHEWVWGEIYKFSHFQVGSGNVENLSRECLHIFRSSKHDELLMLLLLVVRRRSRLLIIRMKYFYSN